MSAALLVLLSSCTCWTVARAVLVTKVSEHRMARDSWESQTKTVLERSSLTQCYISASKLRPFNAVAYNGGSCEVGEPSCYSNGTSTVSVWEEENVLTYEGCYDLSTLGIVVGTAISDNTPQKCGQSCNKLNYNYAGLVQGNRCYCTAILPGDPLNLFEQDHCKDPCTGDTGQICGDTNKMSIYRVEKADKAAFWKMNAYERSLWDITGTNSIDANSGFDKINDNDFSTNYVSEKTIFPWIQIDMKITQLVKGLYILGTQKDTFSYIEVRIGDTDANTLSIDPGAWKMCSNKLCFTYDESKASKKIKKDCSAPLSGQYISIQKYRQMNTGEQEMAIREVDVILYCGQPSATSGDVCQDNAQSEDDCTLLSSTEGQFEYLGCYDDNPQLYSEYKWYPDFNTVNSCAHKCLATSDSHIYIAIEDGGKCECGDSAPSSMKIVDEDRCDKTCRGDNSLICGGDGEAGVFKILSLPVPQLEYLGCYIDSNDRIYDVPMLDIHGPNLSPLSCARECLAWRTYYTYAGVQGGNSCFCGTTAPASDRKTSESDCSVNCNGDSSLKCGAAWRMNIYRIVGSASIKKLDDKPNWQATGSYEEGIVNTLEERFFPSKAIDGYTDSDPNPNSVYTMYHSRWNENKYPWLQVDLSQERKVHSIQMYGRNDGHEEIQFPFLEIRVGNSNLGASTALGRRLCGNRLCHTTGEYEATSLKMTVKCSVPTPGRYITFQKYREAYYLLGDYWLWGLFMREVNVYHIEL